MQKPKTIFLERDDLLHRFWNTPMQDIELHMFSGLSMHETAITELIIFKEIPERVIDSNVFKILKCRW